MPEGRHIDCPVSPQVPSSERPRGSRRLCSARFQDTASTYYCPSPEPYQPGCQQPYLEDDEWEAAFVFREHQRPGCGDLKWKALVRDGFHCRGCAVVVTSKTSRADHIVPVNRFANLDMANSLDNIQTLCLRCHQLKTEREICARIIWKAGCRETCTSGLGLGSGCNSLAYTTSRSRGNRTCGSTSPPG